MRMVWMLALLFCANLSQAWTLESSEVLSPQDSPVSHVKKTLGGGRALTLHFVFFDSGKCGLEVIDHPLADGTNLSDAMKAAHCLAGVNGGYFQPDRTPLGLVMSRGKDIHPMQKARLLSGLLFVAEGRISLLRMAEYRPEPLPTEMLQSGPFLVDRGKAVEGLDSRRPALRTAILTDGSSRFALLVSEPLTLAELADVLCSPGVVSEWKIKRCLNLDGGASSGLWVGDPPFYQPEISSVRNYLGVVQRHPGL